MERRCVVPGCGRKPYARGYCNAHYIAARKHPGETPEQLALRGTRPRTPDEVRELLLSRLTPGENGCLEWTGATDRRGYGNIRWDGHLWGAHRLAYHLLVAPVSPEFDVCHECDNPPCCNVAHLFLGTHRENMAHAGSHRLMDREPRRGADNNRAKLTEADIRAIRASTDTQVVLAARYGVLQPTISAIKLRKTWAHVA